MKITPIPATSIARLRPTGSDEEALRSLIPGTSREQPESWRGLIVRKPWGREFLCFAEGELEVWWLAVHAGQATSLHAHRCKHTTLLVTEGRIRLHTLSEVHERCVGQAVDVPPGVFHRIEAVDAQACVMEVEDPADKTDLVRLRDRFGRVGQGIEGRSDVVDEPPPFWLGESGPPLLREAAPERALAALQLHEGQACVLLSGRPGGVAARPGRAFLADRVSDPGPLPLRWLGLPHPAGGRG